MEAPPIRWQPGADTIARSRLRHYLDWLAASRGLAFGSYDRLWEWSVADTRAFWASVWDYFGVQASSPYTEVHSDDPMPDTRWFSGATLNYAEHIFRMRSADRPAILFQSERQPLTECSWAALERDTAALAAQFRALGLRPGDRVAAFLPNIPEATVAFLAACSIGAVWSSCSPDFGTGSVVDRFAQIRPKIFIAVDGYQYGGKAFDRRETVAEIAAQLPELEQVILLPYLDPQAKPWVPGAQLWGELLAQPAPPLQFEQLPFGHPIWILYSSGTTGLPKAITHSHGGVLLEHLKYLAFHNDLHPGEVFFWFTTTGWMMWNFLQAALLAGATIALYDGHPGYPDLGVLWRFAAAAGVDHFGTSAPFLTACMKASIRPSETLDISRIRSISSTGSPLPPEAFAYVARDVRPGVWLCSMSGGTDVCTAFVGGVPTEPVYEGEIQRRALGCALYAFDEAGNAVTEEVGEMVVTAPMPSMPVYFWNDPDKRQYLGSYFEMYPGIWRHGDWLKLTARNTLVILGRSDATLNRHGVRIGTAEIYRALDQLPAVRDSLIVNLELEGGRNYMPLFVLLNAGYALDEALVRSIQQTLRSAYSPRHVPDEVIAAPDLPYTISGKKLETPVKKLLMGMPIEKAANPGAMRNPESLEFFTAFRAQRAPF
ncbi:MAG: acetoacetate--CoA ligase [Bacteroidia bacterium]|nr:acetoacetate--CoA ligase [Bacteroidia bacterium]